MKKIKQSDIKIMIENGEVLRYDGRILEGGYEKVALSRGVYGMNGGIVKELSSGLLYGITARNTDLFRLF